MEWVFESGLAFALRVWVGASLVLMGALVQAQPLVRTGSMSTIHSMFGASIDQLASRGLLQANATPATISAPPPPPAAASAAPADVTFVTTLEELQIAVFTERARDIVIQAHLDLRGMPRAFNPVLPQLSLPDQDNRQGLLYASRNMRSMRGNCSDPDAATALGLSQQEAAAMLPLKPRQCVIIVPDTFLVSSGGSHWVDNLFLKLDRQRPSTRFAFMLGGIVQGLEDYPQVTETDFYATNVTFQGEHRGRAYGVSLETFRSRLLMHECIMTDWSGGASPLGLFYSGMATLVDTVFRNMRLSTEIVDVTGGGTVRLVGVGLANVTLTRGRVVSTSNNDYYVPNDFIEGLQYYAEDDAEYDVDAAPVPLDERDEFGSEFVIADQTMSDCVYLLAPPDTILPGCPPASVDKRREIKERGRVVEAVWGPNGGGVRWERLEDRLLKVDAPWLIATRAALGPLPPPPPAWPSFDVPMAGEPLARSALTMAIPVPPGTLVPQFNYTPPVEREDKSGGNHTWVPLVAAAVVVAVVAVLATCCALCARRKPPAAPPKRSTELDWQRAGRSWMSGGLTITTATYATGVTAVVSDQDSLAPASESTESDEHLTRGTVPRSAMNPKYEYALPTRVARLMAGPLMDTDEVAARKATKKERTTRGNGGGRRDVRRLQLPVLAVTQPQPPPTYAPGRPLSASTAGGSMGGSVPGSNTAPLAGTARNTRRQPSLQARSDESGSTVIIAPYNVPDGFAVAPVATQDQTIGGTHEFSTVSTRSWDTLSLPPPPPAEPRREIFGIRLGRTRDATTGTEVRRQQQRGRLWLSPLSGPSTVDSTTDEASTLGQMTGEELIVRLHRQLDAFGEDDLFLGRFEMLGRQQRRRGGQAVVQFAEGATDHCQYAIKFFLDYESFLVEAALYAACFPHVRAEVSDEVLARADATAGLTSSGDAAVPMSDIVARFLPQVDAVCDGSAGGLEDPRRRPLPPCIVMEKGESLHDWSDRAEPDLFTCLAVLSNISKRLADMHAAGYVHRDLKPANVMWLPRANRWTVIDFGCVARAGEVVPLNFTLAYAAPEVVRAFFMQQHYIESAPALDTWSLGVMAFELLTGAPAFKFLSDGRGRVMQRLRGDLPLPWEGELSLEVRRHLGTFKDAILKLLHREPAQRISMREFHISCTKLFAARTTVEA
eukprot:jgi/Ulvmu1/2371/UM130_0002.1